MVATEAGKTGGGEVPMPTMAADNTAGEEGAAAAAASRPRRSFNKPSWLLCTIADLDERIKMVIRKMPADNTGDSFAARANSYYHERPQQLAFLHDLYNNYLSLADRYCQVLNRNSRRPPSRCSSPLPTLKSNGAFHIDDGEAAGVEEVIDSDAESSLSFQLPLLAAKEVDADLVITELVMKNVEYDILLNELNLMEKRCGESSRKMELQKNLLDVLESERLILLNDNTTLGCRVTELVEENKGLASESLFLKRKAAELARCVLKTREDYRVCVLSQKIEDLQGQIHGLEKRNKESSEKPVQQEGGEEVNLEDCFHARTGGTASLRKCFSFNMKKIVDQNAERRGGVAGRKAYKLWDKVKKFDLLLCRPQLHHHYNNSRAGLHAANVGSNPTY